MVVKDALIKQGLHPVDVGLGEVEVSEDLSKEELGGLDKVLQGFGFALINDKKSRLIERVKNLVIDLVQKKNNKLDVKLSEYLSAELHQDYTSVSNLFTQVEGTTIEKYFIAQKIERVKELLVYDELSLNEIANQLHYSSVAHLSSQFKKVTGLTPSHFRKLKEKKRTPLEEL